MNEVSIELRSAVKAIKTAILQSQYRAAKAVNREQLSLYFGIGKYVSENSRKGFWGTGAIETISEQLQKELPGLRGFGARNLKNMRIFYEEWAACLNSAAVAAELPVDQNRPPMADDFDIVDFNLLMPSIRQPMAAKIDFDEFVSLGFTHHVEILSKAKDVEERLFYIHQAHINQWNKYRLRDMLKADLYHHQATLPNNFGKAMPDTRSALKALEIFKTYPLPSIRNLKRYTCIMGRIRI